MLLGSRFWPEVPQAFRTHYFTQFLEETNVLALDVMDTLPLSLPFLGVVEQMNILTWWRAINESLGRVHLLTMVLIALLTPWMHQQLLLPRDHLVVLGRYSTREP